MEDERPGIVLAERHIAVPTTDVTSYAFGEYGAYDVDKPIYVDTDDASNFVTARAARTMVRRLIGGLKAHGLEAGDCVSLHAYNNALYPILWLAAIGAGGCISGSNPANTTSELKHHLRISNTKFIISQEDCFTAIAQAAEECGIPRARVFILAPSNVRLPDGYLSYEALLEYGEEDWEKFGPNETKADETVAVLSTTSGTTGLPKSAVLSHRYVVAQAGMIQEHVGKRRYDVSQLVCLPVFHAFAAQIALVIPLRCGITTYFMRRFNLFEFAERINRYSITDTTVVPPIVTALLKLDPKYHFMLRSLRYIICAGAPMNAHLQAMLYDLLAPGAVVAQCWGTTETGWITLFDSHEKDSSGSVGRLLPNVHLKLVSEDGRLINQDNVYGEGLVHSPSILKAYLQDPAATQAGFDADGFFKTGDRIFMRSGKIFIDSRIKDIMKVKGWQLSPAELESLLLQHPQILDVAVVGVPSRDADGLEEILPRAYVVQTTSPILKHTDPHGFAMRSQAPDLSAIRLLTEAEVVAWVSSRVSSYKKLSGGAEFVDFIPRSATGKILRRILRDSRSSPHYLIAPMSPAVAASRDLPAPPQA